MPIKTRGPLEFSNKIINLECDLYDKNHFNSNIKAVNLQFTYR